MGALLGALAVAEDRSQLAVLADLLPALLAEEEALRKENQQLHEELDTPTGPTADECDADAILADYERLLMPAQALAVRVDELEATWRSSSRNLELAAHQLGDPKARATVAVLKARDALRAALEEEGAPSDG
jgi:hypothetical protein